jgi:hypothetical protein
MLSTVTFGMSSTRATASHRLSLRVVVIVTPSWVSVHDRRPGSRYGYSTKVPWSTIVITVSKCIIARLAGSSTAITAVTPPVVNSAWASISTAIGVVRSPMPIITAPLPSTCTSPPSMLADRYAASSSP